jgi:GNAT superfamily N-acetyltransferase
VKGLVGNEPALRIRTSPRPGDAEAIADLHERVYRHNDDFGLAFVEYVARGLATLTRALERDPGAGRLWVLEAEGGVRGSIAIVRTSPAEAQLRWFLVAPELRGRGLGRRLLADALAYVESEGYESVFLLTVKGLDRAAELYRRAGFVLASQWQGASWGDPLTEQRYELRLDGPPRARHQPDHRAPH